MGMMLYVDLYKLFILHNWHFTSIEQQFPIFTCSQPLATTILLCLNIFSHSVNLEIFLLCPKCANFWILNPLKKNPHMNINLSNMEMDLAEMIF